MSEQVALVLESLRETLLAVAPIADVLPARPGPRGAKAGPPL